MQKSKAPIRFYVFSKVVMTKHIYISLLFCPLWDNKGINTTRKYKIPEIGGKKSDKSSSTGLSGKHLL